MVKTVINNGIPFNVRVKGDIVEFYDARYVEGFTEYGQFVSSYYIDTLKDFDCNCTLILYGGVDDWKISSENMKEILNWLNSIKTS